VACRAEVDGMADEIVGQICEQIKDPKRNGGKTLAAIHEHMAHDSLVGWAWMPGGNREPAPGTQAQLGALIGAWIQSGAACPHPDDRCRCVWYPPPE